ncbi:hypothetical protein HPB49_022953 [Dermacentor silvarum]|uniref:Uncharacterized protein n=1 Tax=Dermacentor silvarum TaxID=543639 RepID=A0ACB8DG65_DERSI|nr:hypothetical protein HPB49_022953 [Dermacentor silvarum]
MRYATNESQKMPEEFAEAASAFLSSANSLRRRYGYTLYNMANMDQTMVRIDNPANRTNNVIGKSTIRIANTGCARARLHGLPSCLHHRPQAPSLHYIQGAKQENSSQGLCEPSHTRVLGPNVDDVRRLLVLDQAPIHKTQAAKNAFEEYDTDVLYVPAGCTSILQPADVYWNKPFKSTLRHLWEQFMCEEE